MDAIDRVLRRLRARVDGMITRAVIGRVNDALKTQRLQLTLRDEAEVSDNIEHMQPYGLSFVPPEGAEAIALAVMGNAGHRVAICAQHPEKRPKGGEAKTGGLYTEGIYRVYIDADGVVHIGPDAVTRLAEAFIARADITDSNLDKLRSAFNNHVHATAATGSPSTPTAVPGSIPVAQLDSVAATKGKVT